MSTAVVTGAASGMGWACVQKLRATTDTLIAVDLKAPSIEGTLGVACDVSDPGSVAALVERVRSEGPLRSLIHAAGLSPTMSDPRRILEVNLVGTQLVLDGFEALVGEGTAAVCFSSSAAYVGEQFVQGELAALVDDPMAADFLDRGAQMISDSGLAYMVSKVGVIRAAGRAAVRWGRRGGRVNSLAPGIIDTPMGQQELAHQPAMKEMLDANPPGRLGRPDEIAEVCAFLVSDAASFVSGIDVLVDGGQRQTAMADATTAGPS